MIVGIFGGTFDPPHLGHLELARKALKLGGVNYVLFVPCLKHAFGKQPLAFEHRARMCELLIQREENMAVSLVEKRILKPGRTLDLVVALEQERPGDSFRLLAGSDIYHDKERWFRFDEVSRRAPPLYFERLDVAPIPEFTLPPPPKISSSQIRESLGKGVVPEDLMSPEVAKYIVENGLYGLSHD